jgi:hypothetical protein
MAVNDFPCHGIRGVEELVVHSGLAVFASIFSSYAKIFQKNAHKGRGYTVNVAVENHHLNDWFVGVFFVVSLLIVYFLPRRYPLSVFLLMALFAIAVSRVADHLLAGPHIDLYDIMDENKVEYADLFTYLLYAPAAYVFVYIYDFLKPQGLYFTLYIAVSSIAGVGVEWVAHIFHVFAYKEWNPFYSFVVYLIVQPLTIVFFRFVRGQYEKAG